MKRSIKYIILSIVLAISVIVVTIPFWNFANNKRIGFFNEGYMNLPIVTNIGKFPSLVIADNESALKMIEQTEIVLKNRNGVKQNNRLYLLVEKRSTIPTKFIKVSINDVIYSIKDITLEEDTDNYYFYLTDVETNAYEEVSVNARIWLSEETEQIESDSALVANFVIR